MWTEHMRTEERVQWMAFPRAAAVAEIGWSPPERRGLGGFPAAPVRRSRSWYASVGLCARGHGVPRAARRRRAAERCAAARSSSSAANNSCSSSRTMRPCTGARAVFLVDIMNPCWIFGARDLDRRHGDRGVGRPVPVQLPDRRGREEIRCAPPTTPEGELEVRVDGCEGELLARLPLAPAAAIRRGHARCRRRRCAAHAGATTCACASRGRAIDPMWAIDSIELAE